MLEFLLTTPWGWACIAHVIGWVAFQPYIVRAMDRNVLVNCPEGNTDEYCKKYHDPTCRMRNGLSKNVDADAMWWGTIVAFFWEIVTVGVFFVKRANKPDAIQKEALKIVDEKSLEQLKEYHARLADQTKALAAGKGEASSEIIDDEEEDEVVDGEFVSDAELREVHRKASQHMRAHKTDRYENPLPAWMKEAQ